MDKEQQKKLLTEIMEADEKDGLYKTNNMKLYTEEQVHKMLNRARLHKQDDTEMFTNDYLLSQETPIELPSDEDIEKTSMQFYDNKGSDMYFTVGAKWIKEQILNQNKQYGTTINT